MYKVEHLKKLTEKQTYNIRKKQSRWISNRKKNLILEDNILSLFLQQNSTILVKIQMNAQKKKGDSTLQAWNTLCLI